MPVPRPHIGMSIPSAAVSAREASRRTDGRFGEQTHADPGTNIIGTFGPDALDVARAANMSAPRRHVNRDARHTEGSRTFRLEGGRGGPFVAMGDRRGRVGAVPTAAVYHTAAGAQFDRGAVAPDMADNSFWNPPEPSAEWVARHEDRWSAGYVDADQMGRVRRFVHANAPGCDGLPHRIDTSMVAAMGADERRVVAAELAAPFDGDLNVAEAVVRYGAQPDLTTSGHTLTFPGCADRQIAVSEPTWRACGGQPDHVTRPATGAGRGPEAGDEPRF